MKLYIRHLNCTLIEKIYQNITLGRFGWNKFLTTTNFQKLFLHKLKWENTNCGSEGKFPYCKQNSANFKLSRLIFAAQQGKIFKF